MHDIMVSFVFPDHKSRTPIVIVPAAATAVMNIFNAKDFLEGYKLVSWNLVYSILKPNGILKPNYDILKLWYPET